MSKLRTRSNIRSMTLVVGVICFQLALFAVFIRNRLSFRPLAEIDSPPLRAAEISVSLLIPVRNEERVIDQVVIAALNQDWPYTEVIVLNDNSEDGTEAALERLSVASRGRLNVMVGKERPEGWLGKPWACHQLSKAAKGELLVFIDADTVPEESLVRNLVSEYATNGKGLITVWPRQELLTVWEKIVVPLVYYTLLGFLVTDYTQRDPKWIPTPLRKTVRPLFAAACGQCLALPAALYRDIGGHALVQSDVVEDVGIARAVRSLGIPVRMYHGLDAISCRMYMDQSEIFQGFRKNFLMGFGGNMTVFIVSAIIHLILFVLPPIAAIISFASSQYRVALLWAVASMIPIFHRTLLNRWMRWDAWTSLTHVVGVLWFQYLGIIVLTDRLFGRKVTWKGRNVD